MDVDLQTAFLLLLVGMVTVFIILALVVFTGKALIWVINTYFSEEERLDYDYRTPYLDDDVIDKKKLAAIAVAVEVVTKGKGTVVQVERI